VDARALGRRGARIILAVSGGADSMAMLHALAGVAAVLATAGRFAEPRLQLRVAHVHHGLRGRAADADANLVKKTAKQLGLPFHLCRANVKAMAKRKQISIEMAAREARHEFFHKLAKKYRAVIATAHTRDDQAETVLLRLLRGSGTDGLGGIEYKAKIRGLTIVRPMLDVSHAEAKEFLRERKLKWREDASNADDAMKRNRVRHELIPLLEKRFNPRTREILARTASVIRTDSECLGEIAGAELASRLGAGKSLATTNPPKTAIWRRVIYRWLLLHARVAPPRLDNELVLRVEKLAAQTGALTLPGNIALRADYEGLTASRPKKS
jgi:tRNA(Ile)-lysidine synthase